MLCINEKKGFTTKLNIDSILFILDEFNKSNINYKDEGIYSFVLM